MNRLQQSDVSPANGQRVSARSEARGRLKSCADCYSPEIRTSSAALRYRSSGLIRRLTRVTVSSPAPDTTEFQLHADHAAFVAAMLPARSPPPTSVMLANGSTIDSRANLTYAGAGWRKGGSLRVAGGVFRIVLNCSTRIWSQISNRNMATNREAWGLSRSLQRRPG